MFQFYVLNKGAVGHARAGGAGTLFGHGLLCSCDTFRIECQAKIVIGARQDDLVSIDYTLGRGEKFFGHSAKWHYTQLFQLGTDINNRLEFVKQAHCSTVQFFEFGSQIVDSANIRQDIKRDRHVNMVLDLLDQLHNLQRGQAKFGYQFCVFVEQQTFLGKRLEDLEDALEEFAIVRHEKSVVRSRVDQLAPNGSSR